MIGMAPIPYNNPEPPPLSGIAAFLKIESVDSTIYRGALLLINSLGEPRGFTYNQVEIPFPFLWPKSDLLHRLYITLITSLFDVCAEQPNLLLYLENEIPPDFFSRQLLLSMPHAAVQIQVGNAPESGAEQRLPETDPQCQVIWGDSEPEESSLEKILAHQLSKRGLIAEPFIRATAGLKEVYSK
jgi:hypothetical protein